MDDRGGLDDLKRARDKPARQAFSAIVMAGGRASRMGGLDKAFLSYEGQTIFERIRAVLVPRVVEIIVVTPSSERYPDSVRTTSDRFTGCGPLGGLHAGLLDAHCGYAIAVACDMPTLSPALVDFLLDSVRDEDAVVPRWDGRLQTLHAVYSRRLVDPLGVAIRGGVRAMHEFLSSVRVRVIEPEEIEHVPGAGASFFNVNSPEDLTRHPGR